MTRYVVRFREIDQTQVALVGGKGAHLGELTRIDGVRVPPGYCVTTEAFRRVVAGVPAIGERLDRLARLGPDDREAIGTFSAELRHAIETVTVPDDLAAAITGPLAELGDHEAYAVRSSATAEDLPTASFAGQHDSYLNIVGAVAVLEHVRRCWASLFSARAVAYRLRNGVEHRKVHMAVVVQRMVLPRVAGVLFTADPVTSNRKVATVEAAFGLGEALVSGLVNADSYQVRGGEILSRAIGAKRLAVHAAAPGGTEHRPVEAGRQERAALTDAEVLRLERLSRRIEAHFGRPQDIEWCLAGDEFLIVQSRPITTLYPVPAVSDDEMHVYVSVGHQQMMTDAMKPLGYSMWQLTARIAMHEAGGRLFVDIARTLAAPASRAGLLQMVERADPLLGDALRRVIDRTDLLPAVPAAAPPAVQPPAGQPAVIEADPGIVAVLIEQSQASLAALRRDIQTTSGPALFDFIVADVKELQQLLFDPRNHQAIMAGMDGTWWLNEHLRAWLGEKNAADTLTQSVPDNVTSEMGLALLDVADVIRPFPDVVEFLQRVEDDGFLDELPALPGGRQAREAIQAYLDTYGMRCVGEIDITQPRWSEHPTALVPMILSNVKHVAPGERERRFEQGRQEAWKKEQEVLALLRTVPDGERKAAEVKRMIDLVRAFIGYREYPKYHIVSRHLLYKQALLREADRLVEAGVLGDRYDTYYLTFQEFHDAVRTHHVADGLIRERRDTYTANRALTPPRVFTSDGEVVTGTYRRDDLPPGALAGLPVSAGTAEGRARVILDMADADLEPGDILVTAFTDPSWTPVFVAVEALVTEVGGLMTHGAVIAREYGLPAVVGVEGATKLIRDGQRIRVHGTDGYIEILSEQASAAQELGRSPRSSGSSCGPAT